MRKKRLKMLIVSTMAVLILASSTTFIVEGTKVSAATLPMGLYDISATSNGYISMKDFRKLSKENKKLLFKNKNVYFVSPAGVVSAFDILISTDQQLAAKTATVEAFQNSKNVDLSKIAGQAGEVDPDLEITEIN